MSPTTGQILNTRYRIVKQLGQGGFGAVYRAWDLNLNRPCAIKENLDASPDAQRQFEREARVLAGLQHPNVVEVTDYFNIPGQGQFIVMQFVEGEDLECMLERQGKLDPGQALGWIDKICGALEYLHSQNPPVLHRDIKPANIRLNGQGEPVLVDFGLLKVYTAGQKTTTGARAVTPGYSPTEQYGHGITDARTDVYALGATLYALLTGAPPDEAIQRIADPLLTPVRLPNAKAANQLDAVLSKALEVNSAQRYDSVNAFRKALSGVSYPTVMVSPMLQPGGVPLLAPQVPPKTRRTAIWVNRLVIAGLVVALAVAVAAAFANSNLRTDYANQYWRLAETATAEVNGFANQISSAESAITAFQATIDAQTLLAAGLPPTPPELKSAKAAGTIVFGPSDGDLSKTKDNIREIDSANVNLTNFVSEVDFMNHDDFLMRDGSHHVLFRYIENSSYYRFVIKNYNYFLYYFDSTKNHEVTIQVGQINNFRKGDGEVNRISIICQGSKVLFYVNNELITSSQNIAANPGNVMITDIFPDQAMNIQPTQYRNFTVWEIH